MNLLGVLIVYIAFLGCYAKNFTPVVSTNYGQVRGVVDEYKGVKVFKYMGIPFAQPPIHELRFMKPVSPQPWTDIKTVIGYGKSCVQNMPIDSSDFSNQSEDCLFINVFATEAAINERSSKLRPVLFWIYGGAFATGSDHQRNSYDPIPIVPMHDVILVTFNYRLAAFGFFFPGTVIPQVPGNQGIWDQYLALRWTKENIANFGGDPDLITIFGESAGSMSVGLHLISPLSRKLFKNAIMESGAPWPVTGNKPLEDYSRELINALNCSKSQNALKCLQDLPARSIANILVPIIPLILKPKFGDELLPWTPEEFFAKKPFLNDKNVLVGAEKNDGSVFAAFYEQALFDPDFKLSYEEAVEVLTEYIDPKEVSFFQEHYFGPSPLKEEYNEEIFQVVTDLLFLCPTFVFGQKLANISVPGVDTYAYLQTQVPTISYLKVCNLNHKLSPCHTDDIPLVFGAPFRESAKDFRVNDFLLSINFMKIWTHFARTGIPPNQGPVQWPGLKQGEPRAVEMNEQYIGRLISSRFQFCVDHWDHFHAAAKILHTG